MGVLVDSCKTVGLVAFYYSFSISLTFYNKWILTVSGARRPLRLRIPFKAHHPCFQGYPFPLSITMIHLIVKFLIAWIVRKLISLVTGKTPLVLGWREYIRNISPVGESSSAPCHAH